MSNAGSSKPPISPGSQLYGDTESGGNISGRRTIEPLSVSVSGTESRGSFATSIGSPLVASTPGGKLLSMILQQERQFFELAVSEQLNELTPVKLGADAHKNLDSSSTDALLHERIEDVQEKERQAAVEDIIYMSIVNKFDEFEVPMVPKLSKSTANTILDIRPSKCRELASIHCLEVQEMIKEHVARILRMRGKTTAFDGPTTAKINRLHLGRIYAASVMYGYFLMSACFRRDLDKSLDQEGNDASVGVKLSSYVKGFDTETLQRCAKIKSKEAVNVIEKHTWVLFGGDELARSDGDDELVMTFLYLERNVLEAVAFGCFLFDVERSMDSVYELTTEN